MTKVCCIFFSLTEYLLYKGDETQDTDCVLLSWSWRKPVLKSEVPASELRTDTDVDICASLILSGLTFKTNS